MLYTLRDLRELVSPFVLTGGSCPDSATVRNRINESIRRLLSEGKADWVQTQRRIRLVSNNCIVTLPREFESARVVNIDKGYADLLPQNYQYLEGGPGFENPGEHYGYDLMDDGDGWCTFFDIPQCDTVYYLYAASTVLSDLDKVIQIRGRKENGEEIIQSSGLPGYQLPIAVWHDGVEGSLFGFPEPLSTVSFNQITGIQLPAGRKGYVSLFAVNPETRAMFFLSKYHPDETVPSYRRYKMLTREKEGNRVVDLLCKVRYIPATRDDDVLLVQNPDAIKTMVMAIREENAGNIQASLMLEEKANQQLAKQLANNRSGDPILRVQDHFNMGSVPSIV